MTICSEKKKVCIPSKQKIKRVVFELGDWVWEVHGHKKSKLMVRKDDPFKLWFLMNSRGGSIKMNTWSSIICCCL